MKTIILPGFSLHNKEWAYEVKEKLNSHECVVYEWSHWKGGEFKVETESINILELIGKNKVNIVAKSIGTLAVMYLLERVKPQINKIILCGIPLWDIDEDDKKVFEKVLPYFPVDKIVVFQNEKDNHGTYEQVKEFLGNINPKTKVVSRPRSDHDYPYFEEFEKFLT